MKFEEKRLILLQGPKGVGKSLSLLALAAELHSNYTHTERVLYCNFSTINSPHTTEKNLRKCDCSCELSKLCAELIESETRTWLLLDVGRI